MNFAHAVRAFAATLLLTTLCNGHALAQATPPAGEPPAQPPPAEQPAAAQPATQPPAATTPAHSGPARVRFDTTAGSFTVQLNRDRAPFTVDNFLRYVNEGHYSGTTFHRVIDNFVAQGGGYTAEYKTKPVHEGIVNEAGNGLTNRRGTIAMARTDKPHSANAQFYLNLADNPDLDPMPTRWGYAVFGEVVEGMDVIDRIGHVATGAAGEFRSDVPLKPIVIEKATLLP
jgi:peptidyl-prolyl cis-trans isomerase A (cyclophilin A)